MVSFEEIRNIRLHYVDPRKHLDMRDRLDLMVLWAFSICYLISTNASKASTSILSLLGMYYAIGDMITYYYVKHIVKRNEAENLNQETDETDTESNSTVDGAVNQAEAEAEDDADDENELRSEMMPNLFRKTTNTEDEDENEQRSKKSLEQLREFEEAIRKKNLGVDDYSDIPPPVKLDSVDWSSTNLLTYMNPNLRQPGQYAASLNETDE